MKKVLLTIGLFGLMLTLNTSCTKEEQPEPPHIVRSESDTHGFAPTGNTEIKGLFDYDTVMHSSAILARTINTYTYSDGHVEIDTLPYEFTLEMGDSFNFYAQEPLFSADSTTANGNGLFYAQGNQSDQFPGQFTIALKENGAPLEAHATIDYAGSTVELHFTR